jgi:hypothetical protein
LVACRGELALEFKGIVKGRSRGFHRTSL